MAVSLEKLSDKNIRRELAWFRERYEINQEIIADKSNTIRFWSERAQDQADEIRSLNSRLTEMRQAYDRMFDIAKKRWVRITELLTQRKERRESFRELELAYEIEVSESAELSDRLEILQRQNELLTYENGYLSAKLEDVSEQVENLATGLKTTSPASNTRVMYVDFDSTDFDSEMGA